MPSPRVSTATAVEARIFRQRSESVGDVPSHGGSSLNPDAPRPGTHIHDRAAAAHFGHQLVLGDGALHGHRPVHRDAPGAGMRAQLEARLGGRVDGHAARAGVCPDVTRAGLFDVNAAGPGIVSNLATDPGCAYRAAASV